MAQRLTLVILEVYLAMVAANRERTRNERLEKSEHRLPLYEHPLVWL